MIRLRWRDNLGKTGIRPGATFGGCDSRCKSTAFCEWHWIPKARDEEIHSPCQSCRVSRSRERSADPGRLQGSLILVPALHECDAIDDHSDAAESIRRLIQAFPARVNFLWLTYRLNESRQEIPEGFPGVSSGDAFTYGGGFV